MPELVLRPHPFGTMSRYTFFEFTAPAGEIVPLESLVPLEITGLGVLIMASSSKVGGMAIYTLHGGANVAIEVLDSQGNFSPVAGIPNSWNILADGDKTYSLQQTFTSSPTLAALYLGRR